MSLRRVCLFIALVLAVSFSTFEIHAADDRRDQSFKPSSPFATALETLQEQIGYTFMSIGLLRRAMTHSSFSEENNKALSILGGNVIETSVSLRFLYRDIDISSQDLNRHISDILNVDSSCAVDGMRLGLQKVIRVSPKFNSTIPGVVCGGFRAIFGAIALDTQKSDDAGDVFWRVHGGTFGKAMAFKVQVSAICS